MLDEPKATHPHNSHHELSVTTHAWDTQPAAKPRKKPSSCKICCLAKDDSACQVMDQGVVFHLTEPKTKHKCLNTEHKRTSAFGYTDYIHANPLACRDSPISKP